MQFVFSVLSDNSASLAMHGQGGDDMGMNEKLKRCRDFGSVFGLVKDAVEDTMGERRPGLMLALQQLPENIGALHPVGTSFIVMNKDMLKKVRAFYGQETFNSCVFYVLLHEYLHTLGYLNEADVYRLSYLICRRVLGERHASTMIARHGIGSVMPEIGIQVQHPSDDWLEIVDGFDSENMSYIG